MREPDFTGSWNLPTLGVAACVRSGDDAEPDFSAGTVRDQIITAMAASFRLGQCMLDIQQAGMPLLMSHQGLWTRDRLDGVWACQVQTCKIKPSDPDVRISVTMTASNCSFPNRPRLPCPDVVGATDTETRLAEALAAAFSSVPANIGLLVAYAPAYSVWDVSGVRVTTVLVDEKRAVMVDLKQRQAPPLGA